MLVLFPRDMMTFGLGEEILIEVTGIEDRPKMKAEVLAGLAHDLASVVAINFPRARIVCRVRQNSPWDVATCSL